MDLVVEADMKPYDFLAMVPIVEGSGGVITNWKVITLKPYSLKPYYLKPYGLNPAAPKIPAVFIPALTSCGTQAACSRLT